VTDFIRDYPLLPRLAGSPLLADEPFAAPAIRAGAGSQAGPRVGVVSNRRSHRNRRGRGPSLPGGDVIAAAPETRAELTRALARFRLAGVELLVVDGGDGTVRDVLTCGAAVWGGTADAGTSIGPGAWVGAGAGNWPTLAVLPSGKTNALAIDLGVPSGWDLADAVASFAAGRTRRRSPLGVTRDGAADAVPLRGFLFGAGAFVGATELAQHTHRAGAFKGLAVGLALGWALAQTALGRDTGRWRAGASMRLSYRSPVTFGHVPVPREEAARYLLLASALDDLPLGIRPFGPPRPGLKTLAVDAPPRRLAAAVPAILAGSTRPWLSSAGYHHVDAAGFDLEMEGNFILDGELFPGGSLRVTEEPALDFAVP